ncbi:hypothetical protein BDR22DRAFT_830991 [Usnea florida]
MLNTRHQAAVSLLLVMSTTSRKLVSLFPQGQPGFPIVRTVHMNLPSYDFKDQIHGLGTVRYGRTDGLDWSSNILIW